MDLKSPVVRTVRGKTDSIPVQVFRYAAGGAAAFGVDFVVLVLLTELIGWHYLVSATVGFACGMATHYAVSIVWVFHRRSVRNRPIEFAAFAVLGLFGLSINVTALYLLTEFAGFHYTLSKILASIPSFAWNFTSRKVLLFSARDRNGASESSPSNCADEAAEVAV
jgi:putative flippase GtrA